MADISYHLDRGETLVTLGTAQGTSDIELIVDNAVNVTRKDVLLALERFERAVQEDDRFAGI